MGRFRSRSTRGSLQRAVGAYLFNKEVLTKNAFYFKSKQCVVNLLEKINKKDYYKYTNNNLDRIKEIYDTNKIISEYENHLKYVCKKR